MLLLAVEDVIGENATNTVLTTARLPHLVGRYPPPDFEPGLTFDETGQLFEAIEGIYGVRGGRRLAREMGEESFKYWIEGFGGLIGLAEVGLQILPIATRARIGIEALAEIFNRYTDLRVELGEGSQSYFFVLESCGFCAGRHTEEPACSFAGGLLEETLFWTSRGRRFAVEETTCIACGDPACTFYIDKTPATTS